MGFFPFLHFTVWHRFTRLVLLICSLQKPQVAVLVNPCTWWLTVETLCPPESDGLWRNVKPLVLPRYWICIPGDGSSGHSFRPALRCGLLSLPFMVLACDQHPIPASNTSPIPLTAAIYQCAEPLEQWWSATRKFYHVAVMRIHIHGSPCGAQGCMMSVRWVVTMGHPQAWQCRERATGAAVLRP